MRQDFKKFGTYAEVGRALRRLKAEQIIVSVGYGLYAKSKKSSLTGETVLILPLPEIAREALVKLGVQVSSFTQLEEEYQKRRTN